jgi:copper(I)-binding protein
MMRAFLALLPLLVASCGQSEPSEIRAGHAWARATAPGQSSSAVYATIENVGQSPDRLVGASTDQAAMAMLHADQGDGTIARMRMVEQVDLPAGSQVALKPGGTHIMLEGLTGQLVAGAHFDISLRFERAPAKTLQVQVVAPDER